MISPARKLCYRLLHRIEQRQIFSDDALNSDSMKALDVRDRHLTTEIVYGTLRWQAMLDYILGSVCSRPWSKVDPDARILLRMSLYQMWRMDRIPEYALVDDAVELAKRNLGKGIDGFINGILRRLARSQPWKNEVFLKQAPPWIQVSLPEWLWRRWASRYGERCAQDFALSLNTHPQTAIRLFDHFGIPAAALTGVQRSALVPGAYIRESGADRYPGEGTGAVGFHYQDEASQLVPHLLHVQPGWKIWDVCAAPGGKSAILAMACGSSGRVTASDLSMERMRKLRQSLRDSGARNTDLVLADASNSAPFRCGFDAVLADVPCSGIGTLRRNPEIKWNFEPAEFATLQVIQKSILHHASEAVRVGGSLLYSTCSTEPEENEQVIQHFLRTHPGFSVIGPEYPPGIEKWRGEDGMVRTFPSLHRWDGFFAALMTRQG
ncbi:MAG: 16S rRNA (cytosine(967)-C(5))-methyltransferase RsmB [Acidobacteriota bacterium]|nr:16S rRNA (cytosine(967)-C(5))-methyltransferase RsmB [Acidobacteriota bacterium]